MDVIGWGKLSLDGGVIMVDLPSEHFQDNLTFVGLFVEMEKELVQRENNL